MYVPNGHHIYSKWTKMHQHFLFQGHPPKFTHVVMFGFKIYHLATLGVTCFTCRLLKMSKAASAEEKKNRPDFLTLKTYVAFPSKSDSVYFGYTRVSIYT
jgi:hypothetical protein